MILALAAGAASAQQSQNYYYDPAGRLIVVVDPANGSAIYNYDANGNIVSVTRSPLTTVVAAEVSPSAAAAGATVTIYGTAFGTTANTSVSFNGAAATISAATATSLTVIVPSGAASGPVTVTAPGGSATTLYSFTVLGAAPTVTSVPSTALAQGAAMTIAGTGFDTTPANDVVTINGVRAQVTAATATQLTVTAPATVGVSPVQVETAYGIAASAGSVTILPAGQTASNLQATGASALGSSGTLTFDGSGRAIMVTFAAQQGQSVIISLSGASAALSGTATIALYTPDGDALYLDTASNLIVSGANFGPFVLPSTGVYSLWMVPPASASGSVTGQFVNVSTPVSAALTTSGAAVPLTTTTGGQPMQATFNATGGQIVALQISSPQPNSGTNNWTKNLVLTITGPNGPIYAGSVASNSFTEGLALPAGGTGTYTVSATPAATDFGTLDFTFYNVPPPAAATLTANGTATVLTTTTPGQTFAPTFTGAAGQVVALDMQVQSGTLGSGNGDAIAITGPSGQVYSYSWNWAYRYPHGSHFFSGPITLPTAGVYTITDVPASTETGALQFTLYTVPPAATANLTVGGSATTLSTTTPGQTFAPTFTGTANERITLLLDNISGTLGTTGVDGITIAGPTGVVFSGGVNSNENPLFSGLITLPAAGAGTYTISDVPSFTETGEASFQVTQVPPDPTSSISVGGPAVTLSTTTAGQRIILTFTNSTSQSISLSAANLTGGLAGSQFLVLITAPNGSTLYNGSSSCCGGAYFYSGSLAATQSGTYTVVVTPTNMSTGGATFQLYQETTLTSTLTPGGGSVGVSTTAPEQKMNLTMPETAGHRVAVLVQFSTNLASQDTLFNITAPDGSTSIWNSNMTPGSSLWTGALPRGNVTSTTPLLTQTGNYALSLQEITGVGTGNATFTAYDVPADLTGAVSVGNNATFNITTPGQGLRATFAGTANAKATFNVAPTSVNPSSACFNVTVLEPDGVTVLNSGQACSGAYSTGSKTLPTTGDYLVVAVPNVPATGSFTVGVTSP